mmetsp:Transcript_12093/g.34215  ORF Transcript_12093/g.34215 Transcript_12093/m.34215 type:complete len:297 (+) Transcript_12093:561-1451(+)
MSNSSFHLLLKVLTTRMRSGLMATPQWPPRVPGSAAPACRSAPGRTSSRSCRSSGRRGCKARRMWSSMSARLSVEDVSRKSLNAIVSSRPTCWTLGSPMCRTTPSTESFCSSVSWKESSCLAVAGSLLWSMRLMFPKPALATAWTICLSAGASVSRPADMSCSVATSASASLSSSMRAVTRVAASSGGCRQASAGCSGAAPGGGPLEMARPAQAVTAVRASAASVSLRFTSVQIGRGGLPVSSWPGASSRPPQHVVPGASSSEDGSEHGASSSVSESDLTSRSSDPGEPSSRELTQ